MFPAPTSHRPRAYNATRPPTRRSHVGVTLAIAFMLALGALASLPSPAFAQGTANVTGTVTDDSIALTDATVELRRPVAANVWEIYSARTTSDGRYSLTGVAPGEWSLTVRLDGFRTNESKVTLASGDQTIDVKLRSMFAYEYRATVRDVEGNPISGVQVVVRGGNDQARGERSATTDAAGLVTVKLFSRDNSIEFTKRGYERYHDYQWSPSQDVVRDIQLSSAPIQSVTVKGTVVDASGVPVQAWIDLQTDWSREEARRGQSEGTATPQTEPDPDAPASSSTMIAPSSMPYYRGKHNSTATAEDGTFSLKAYPGALLLQANRRGYLVEESRRVVSEGETWEVTFTLIALPERTVTIKGQVTDQKTGAPIPGASVSTEVPDAGDSQWTQTDQDGRYEVKVRPGQTTIEVRHWGGIYYIEQPIEDCGVGRECIQPVPAKEAGPSKEYHPKITSLTTQPGQTHDLTHRLTARPTPPTTIVGYVIDETTQQAIPNAQVSLENHDSRDYGHAQTDGTGSFKFEAYGGYHTISVWVDGYLPKRMNIQVPTDGALRHDIVVTPGHYASEGWWDPNQQGGGECCVAYDTSVASEGTYAPPMAASDRGGGAPSEQSKASSTPASPQSGGALRGAGGGLPAYDPARSGDTFGNDNTKESPLPWTMLLVTGLGLLALAGGLRRRNT